MKVGHELPVDGTAARVITRGESFEYRVQSWSQDSALPLPVREPPNTPSFVDLTGLRIGRLVVIGFSADRNARWVCRCDCGTYTLRKTPALRAGTAAPCDQCYLMATSKAADHHRRTGQYKPVESFL